PTQPRVLPAATNTPPPPAARPTPPAPPTAVADRPSAVPASPTQVPVPTAGPPVPATIVGGHPVVDGIVLDAYVPAATKLHQYYHYTCEFDAAWVVLKTYGIDATLDEMVAIIGLDHSGEPRWEETKTGVMIYGGDITQAYSGDYTKDFLARSTGLAMRKVFAHYGLGVTPVHTQGALEAALRRGELVWIKTTADFLPGRPATWVMPDGRTWQTVLGNDHAAVVMGYNADGAYIRDVLGPTSTNRARTYQYLVPWDRFLAAWASQSWDGLAVAPPGGP
ncbi:MAG TPA: C39 family peptidase, partial [Chloroflexia bacterium]|nr:C39 family peptidase [Chloroflexia bacterium]